MGNETIMNLSTVSEAQNAAHLENNSSEIESTANSKTDIVQKIKTNLFRQERDRLWKILKQIRQATELNQFLQKTSAVLRQELKVDRAMIYRFENEHDGLVVAESLNSGWTPCLSSMIPCLAFGAPKASDYSANGFMAIERASLNQVTPHQQQLLNQLQTQASLAVPIMLDGDCSETNTYGLNEVWGLLIVQQCHQNRQWQEDEVNLLYQLTIELTRILQPSLSRLQSVQQEDLLTVIDSQMQQSMQKLLNQVRYSLKAERALIYGFNPDWSGEILAESVDSQWVKTGNVFDHDCFLTSENCQPQYVVNDIYKQNFAPCLIEAFEAMSAKAYIAVPVKHGDRLIGMLAVYQNSTPRIWKQPEVQQIVAYANQFSSYLQQTVSIRHASFQAKQFEKLSQADSLLVIEDEAKQLMQRMLHQIRQLTRADRALIYAFNPDGSGAVLAESKDTKWSKVGTSFDNDCFLTIDNCQSQYVVNDIYNKNFAPCLIEQLETMEAKAYIAIPVKQGDRLMGMLAVYQNSSSRNWQESEVILMQNYAIKFSSPLQKTSLIRISQFQAKKLEKSADQDLLTSMNQEAQESMKNWLDKIRQSMKVDRAVVYGFNPDWSGEVLAESYSSNWKPTGSVLDQDFHFKGGEFAPYYIANDLQSKGLARAVLEKFEQMQVKAYMVVPIHVNNQLLGLLGVYQNSGPRNWQEPELMQVQEYATRFIKPLQQTSYWRSSQFQSTQMEQAFKRERSLGKILEKVRLSKDEQAVFQIATSEGRKICDVDRVAIYRFNEDWSGNFIAESAAPGWSNLTEIIPFIEDTFLQNTKGGRYKNGESFAVEDIYLAGHKECHIELLEQMEARAYVLAPIFIADSNMFGSKKLWGLIGIYQNTGARRWQAYEIEVVRQLGLQVGIALQQINYLKQIGKQIEQEKASNRIVEKIRRAENIDEIFKVATEEVRQSYKADRAVVYQFNPDWTGQVVAESVGSSWVSLLVEQNSSELLSGNRTKSDRCILRKWSVDDITEVDTYLEKTRGGKYTGEGAQKFTAVNDIYQQKFPDCYIASLEKYQAKAYIIAPIFQDNKLWGLLGVYQNSSSRNWEESEIRQMVQIANQLAVAIQQAEYVQTLESQAQENEAISKISDRIRSSLDIKDIFRNATQEVRKLTKSDRCIVYRFNPNWSGQVVAESVGSEWVSLVEIQQADADLFSVDMNANEHCTLINLEASSALDKDTYFLESKGGNYTRGKKFNVVNDIYAANFSSCYLQSLEKYQAKAYVIVPIFQGTKLWGLFAIYQNSKVRTWRTNELNLLLKIAPQLGIAIEQVEKTEQLKINSENLAQTLAREKAAKEELQKQALDILKTVRPAFSGDLTVRANVTETEIGTVAGAYNTTLDSLREIVVQVKETVEIVADTTGNSSSAMEGLSMKAQKQLQELELAVEQIQATIKTSTTTTQNAQKVESAIEQADLTVQYGDRAMNKTVESILSIRDTVADAGKRVKRLSDSSQKISRVVNLISSFAAQTNLLALNAALEATRAGEYGKGFAVVADEVRNLSLQSSEATTEIEKLVREIQAETQEVAAAMETGVQQVAEGTNLVNETRDSLNKIVTSTKEIRELVKDISLAADAQTKQAESATKVVGQVAEIANETSEDSQRISSSFQELEKLAQNLQNSVSRFKVK